MGNKTINTKQGHWILAKMGKKSIASRRQGTYTKTHSKFKNKF